jgi:hypothetical protein
VEKSLNLLMRTVSKQDELDEDDLEELVFFIEPLYDGHFFDIFLYSL